VGLCFMAVILILGVFPAAILEKVIVPMSQGYVYDQHHLAYLLKTSVWHVHDLTGILVALLLGGTLYVFFVRKDLFSLQLPGRFGVEHLFYRPILAFIHRVFTSAGKALEEWVNRGYLQAPVLLGRVCTGMAYFDGSVIPRGGQRIVQAGAAMGERIYSSWKEILYALFSRVALRCRRLFMFLFKVDYRPSGDHLFQTINISNLDFDLLIIIVVIGVIIAARLIFIF
jgi:hypothetical protein